MNAVRAVWLRFQPFRTSVLLVCIFAVGFALGSLNQITYAQDDTRPSSEAAEAFRAFWQVYNLIQTDYIDSVDSQVLVDGAIKGMVDALGDRFSGYMDPEVYPFMNDDLSGSIEGIGAVIETLEDSKHIAIVNVLEGSPAEAAGVRAGDIFYIVNGEDVTGIDQFELVKKVRGPAGTTVEITMKRGEELIEFSIVRARIELENVRWELLDNNIGYIRLRDFSADARPQIDSALEKLDMNNLNGLVFDLRGNPGGLLTSAIEVTSAFLKEGIILIEDFGGRREQVFNANGTYIGVSVPLVILVDETSASASELVAGALQDQGRATIVGEVTFGKGTVQTWRPLVNGGGIRLTIARWLTPNRNWIHGQGVTPDILIEWSPEGSDGEIDPQLKAAVEFLESSLTLSPAGK